MNATTLDELNKLFPDEVSCRKYLAALRWGKWPKCPYCNNQKAYIIEKGKRYKCANPDCYKKFSVTVKTLLEGLNMPLTKWMTSVFLYVRARSRVFTWDLEKGANISPKAAFYTKEKIDYVWKLIKREGKDRSQLFNEVFESLFNSYDHLFAFRKMQYGNHFFHVHDIDDISDPKQYDMLCRYARMRMMYCEWIYLNFADAQDVMATVFLYMSDNAIKEYNAESMVRLINSTIGKMWYEWVQSHPNIAARYRDRHKQWKRDWRLNMKNGYIVELMTANKKYSELKRSEIKSMPIEIKNYKQRLKEERERLHKLYEWNSHFS